METDITPKVIRWCKIGAVGIVTTALVISAGVYLWQQHDNTVTVRDAMVGGVSVGVRAKANGKIKSLDAANDSTVEVGDLLATMEVSVTDEEIAQLEQNLELAKHNLAEVEKGQTVTVPVVIGTQAPSADLAAAESRMKRMNELFEMGAISQIQRDKAAGEYEAAKAAAVATPLVTYETKLQPSPPETIEAARLVVSQAETALVNAKNDRAATEITAPIAGRVAWSDDMTEGNEIHAGDVIMSILGAGDMWVELHLTDKDAARVRLGQFADVTVDGMKLSGTVTDIQKPIAESEVVATEGMPPTDDKTTVHISLPTTANVQNGQRATAVIFVGNEQ